MKLKKRFTHFLYWLGTSSPLVRIVQLTFGHHAYDGKGFVTLPKGVKANTSSSILFRLYERPERLMIKRWLPSDIDCVELGSSIGIVSREAVSRLGKKQTFVAVEADSSLALTTRLNIIKSRPSCNLVLVNAAIAYGAEKVNFAKNCGTLSGRITHGEDNGRHVVATSLGKILRENSISKFSLVMDIEGMEYELIREEPQSLSGCELIIAELHGPQSDKEHFCNTLSGLGYRRCEDLHNVFVFSRIE